MLCVEAFLSWLVFWTVGHPIVHISDPEIQFIIRKLWDGAQTINFFAQFLVYLHGHCQHQFFGKSVIELLTSIFVWWGCCMGSADYVGVSKNRGGPPKRMVKIMENPIKLDDLGVPLFLETSMLCSLTCPSFNYITVSGMWRIMSSLGSQQIQNFCQRRAKSFNGKTLMGFDMFPIPYHPCMVYLPTSG